MINLEKKFNEHLKKYIIKEARTVEAFVSTYESGTTIMSGKEHRENSYINNVDNTCFLSLGELEEKGRLSLEQVLDLAYSWKGCNFILKCIYNEYNKKGMF